MASEDPQTAPAVYYDGYVDRRRVVTLAFGPTLEISEDGALLAAWPYADVRLLRAPDAGVMRIRALGAPKSAWLDIRDLALRAETQAHCRLLSGESPRTARGGRARLGWAALGVALVGAFLWRGVPRAAELIAPIIPDSWEKTLGEGADAQIRKTFSGKTCAASKGAEALKKLSERLQQAAHLRIPATIETLSSKIPNAIALPGGKVYLFSGLLDTAQAQDEILGVLAHELGHLEHRDHLRRVIATGGTALIVGMIFGDVTGSGAMIVIGNSLLNAAHSREAEAQADDFAAKTMAELGRPAKPMGELLLRVTGSDKNGYFTILHDHPLSEDRLAKLAAADKGASARPLLSDDEWKALKTICD